MSGSQEFTIETHRMGETIEKPGARFVLASRSPQRLELLRQIVPPAQIEVLPPRSSDEAGFDRLHDWTLLEQRLTEIARTKCEDVCRQIAARTDDHIPRAVIAADTIIVVRDGEELRALGQPPDDDSWQDVVRRWFTGFYAGKTHWAVTALCVAAAKGTFERIVRSEVSMAADVERWLEWYLATGEPRGKAGGYAIQGAGSLFITRVEGSSSNVVGLPIRELREVFAEADLETDGKSD